MIKQKEIKNYKIIVEIIGSANTSEFLNDIIINGYYCSDMKKDDLCFNSVNKAVKAIKTHAENWVGKQDANKFGYDVVPVYKDGDWGKPVKRFEMTYDSLFGTHGLEENLKK